LIPVLALLGLACGLVSGGNFNDDCDATWEPQNCWVYDAGNSLSLALVSNSSGQSILNEISSLICPLYSCTNASTLVCRLMRPISFHFHDCIFVAVSGSMIRSKRQFIYGTVSTWIQLVKGNSAGTVTTYYVRTFFVFCFTCIAQGLNQARDDQHSLTFLR
jgi:xyloglucan:xyloglucosyl transferase